MLGSMKPQSFCHDENPFTVFWNSQEKEFQKEENEPDINITCNSRNHIEIAENKLVFNNDEWSYQWTRIRMMNLKEKVQLKIFV